MSKRIEEIRNRAAAATPGPWLWWGNTQVHQVSLMSRAPGRPTVMAFFRWGMQRAKPSFQDERGLLTDFERDVVYQVCPDCDSKEDRRVYRQDFIDIRHPDAQFIAHAREDVDVLLAEIDRLHGLLGVSAREVTQ